ncbi:MAG: PEP-CTERM sorting domain-containing protein [Phycisphaerales bacterium]|nr:PEP-CTERM sorting domain-containing protein [Phycisphaerales bacterium]
MLTGVYSRKLALLIAAVGVGASTLGAAVTNADMMQTFELSNFNAGDASNPLDATITFDFSVAAKNLTITIDNTTPSTYSAGELIRSVGFSLASVTAPASLNNVAMVGDERTVAGNGSFTDSAELVNARLTSPWTFNPNGGGYTLSAAGSKDLVIGPANANSQYSGNGSIDGNHGHNPFLTSGASFTINLPGITPGSEVAGNNIVVGYGTSCLTASAPLTFTSSSAPEPATLGMLAVGGVGLLLGRRKTSKA